MRHQKAVVSESSPPGFAGWREARQARHAAHHLLFERSLFGELPPHAEFRREKKMSDPSPGTLSARSARPSAPP